MYLHDQTIALMSLMLVIEWMRRTFQNLLVEKIGASDEKIFII